MSLCRVANGPNPPEAWLPGRTSKRSAVRRAIFDPVYNTYISARAFLLLFNFGARVDPSVIFSSRSVLGYHRSMPNSGTKRSRKMVTIHNLHEMKDAAHENDPQTKLLVLGLGEAIVTTCGQARVFLENGSAFGDEPKGSS